MAYIQRFGKYEVKFLPVNQVFHDFYVIVYNQENFIYNNIQQKTTIRHPKLISNLLKPITIKYSFSRIRNPGKTKHL